MSRDRRRRAPTAPADDPPASGGFFAEIPQIIASKGRVRGFEAIRDRVLTHWESLSRICNPYSLLKLAIESDRHALFAVVAEEKARGAFDRDLWERYQDYLHGNVDIVPDQGDYRSAEDAQRNTALYGGEDPFELVGVEEEADPAEESETEDA